MSAAAGACGTASSANPTLGTYDLSKLTDAELERVIAILDKDTEPR
jgi:hypothetical protein